MPSMSRNYRGVKFTCPTCLSIWVVLGNSLDEIAEIAKWSRWELRAAYCPVRWTVGWEPSEPEPVWLSQRIQRPNGAGCCPFHWDWAPETLITAQRILEQDTIFERSSR